MSTSDNHYTPSFEDINIDYTTEGLGLGQVKLRVSQPLNENRAYDSETPDNMANVFWSADGTTW